MFINFIIDTKTEKVFETADKMHNQLKGNPDYIDSRVVLNFDENSKEITVVIAADEVCCTSEKEIVDLLITALRATNKGD